MKIIKHIFLKNYEFQSFLLVSATILFILVLLNGIYFNYISVYLTLFLIINILFILLPKFNNNILLKLFCLITFLGYSLNINFIKKK